jgi:hypothetical protein
MVKDRKEINATPIEEKNRLDFENFFAAQELLLSLQEKILNR